MLYIKYSDRSMIFKVLMSAKLLNFNGNPASCGKETVFDFWPE